MCVCSTFDRRRVIFQPAQVGRALLYVELRRDVTVLVWPIVRV